MMKKMLTITLLFGFMNFNLRADAYYDMPLFMRMGCICETNAQRNAFLTRINNNVARILAGQHNVSAGLVSSGNGLVGSVGSSAPVLNSVLGSSAGISATPYINWNRSYERPALLINFGGF